MITNYSLYIQVVTVNLERAIRSIGNYSQYPGFLPNELEVQNWICMESIHMKPQYRRTIYFHLHSVRM